MRTALRTYHPVPSLQKADANLQDAPRIKNILKACSLKNEASTNMPVTPSELRTRAVSTRSYIHIPPLIDYLPTGIWSRPLYQHRQPSFRPLQSLHRPLIKSLSSFVVFAHSPAVPDRGTRPLRSPRYRFPRSLLTHQALLAVSRSGLPLARLSLSRGSFSQSVR